MPLQTLAVAVAPLCPVDGILRGLPLRLFDLVDPQRGLRELVLRPRQLQPHRNQRHRPPPLVLTAVGRIQDDLGPGLLPGHVQGAGLGAEDALLVEGPEGRALPGGGEAQALAPFVGRQAQGAVFCPLPLAALHEPLLSAATRVLGQADDGVARIRAAEDRQAGVGALADQVFWNTACKKRLHVSFLLFLTEANQEQLKTTANPMISSQATYLWPSRTAGTSGQTSGRTQPGTPCGRSRGRA